ncbi:zinc-binding dehydrogenase, partial [Aeromicrobium sp. CF3.5]|uniref:zinc-binding dehydrogenase n=1 Tax=Aeromicrobium sp. CF3.5 TaxID=3373078 RepID=UPI003EE43793
MRAVVIDDVGGVPTVRDVPEPSAPPAGVVVEVRATGLCRSDWHAWAGHEGVAFPHVPGHELAGVIIEVAPEVQRWSVGDRVTVPFVCGCGRCAWCLAGDAQVCPDQQQPGFSHWGSFAERVVLHAADTNLVALPDAVEFATAASLGCRFATAYRALVGRARLAEGEWVTVVGAGGVGLSTIMIAKALGARVVAVDRNPEALTVATDLGADHAVLADGPDLATVLTDLTQGGSHVAVDAVGSEATCSVAIHSLRRRGRHVQVGLLPASEGHPRVPMERVIGWELDVLGSHGMAAADYPQMMDLIGRDLLRPQRLVE